MRAVFVAAVIGPLLLCACSPWFGPDEVVKVHRDTTFHGTRMRETLRAVVVTSSHPVAGKVANDLACRDGYSIGGNEKTYETMSP